MRESQTPDPPPDIDRRNLQFPGKRRVARRWSFRHQQAQPFLHFRRQFEAFPSGSRPAGQSHLFAPGNDRIPAGDISHCRNEFLVGNGWPLRQQRPHAFSHFRRQVVSQPGNWFVGQPQIRAPFFDCPAVNLPADCPADFAEIGRRLLRQQRPQALFRSRRDSARHPIVSPVGQPQFFAPYFERRRADSIADCPGDFAEIRRRLSGCQREQAFLDFGGHSASRPDGMSIGQSQLHAPFPDRAGMDDIVHCLRKLSKISRWTLCHQPPKPRP